MWRLLLLVVVAKAALVARFPGSIHIDDGNKLFEVDENYISYTIDSTRDRAFFDTDFSDPKLVYLTRQLGPSIVRVGGNGGNYLIYAVGSEANCTRGTELGARNTTMECLNLTLWDNINNLVKTSGSHLVFGLNADYPFLRKFDKQQPPEKWNSSNARAFLQYNLDVGYEFYGLQLGNELSAAMTGKQQVEHLTDLKDLLKELYGNRTIPKLYGPDPHSYMMKDYFWPGPNGQSFRDFVALSKDLVDAYSYHEYIGVAGVSDLNHATLDISKSNALRILNVTDQLGDPKAKVWVGESANRNQGGLTFGFSFGTAMWYADALGVKATLRHSVFCRQDLIGAAYGLLQEQTFDPNPSYWFAVLAKRILDKGVLSVTMTPDNTQARIYSFCAKGYGTTGGIAIMAVSLEREMGLPFTVAFNQSTHNETGTYTRIEYYLTTPNVNSRQIRLNDRLLVLNNSTDQYQFPSLEGLTITESSPIRISLQPMSITFVVIPEANAAACLTAPPPSTFTPVNNTYETSATTTAITWANMTLTPSLTSTISVNASETPTPTFTVTNTTNTTTTQWPTATLSFAVNSTTSNTILTTLPVISTTAVTTNYTTSSEETNFSSTPIITMNATVVESTVFLNMTSATTPLPNSVTSAINTTLVTGITATGLPETTTTEVPLIPTSTFNNATTLSPTTLPVINTTTMTTYYTTSSAEANFSSTPTITVNATVVETTVLLHVISATGLPETTTTELPLIPTLTFNNSTTISSSLATTNTTETTVTNFVTVIITSTITEYQNMTVSVPTTTTAESSITPSETTTTVIQTGVPPVMSA